MNCSVTSKGVICFNLLFLLGLTLATAKEHPSESSVINIISAKYGDTDISELFERKYRLGPNLYYGKMGGPPKGEKGQVWTLRYTIYGKTRMFRGRKGYRFVISDESGLGNAFKLLKVFSGDSDLTEKFKELVAGQKARVKVSELSGNGKSRQEIVLLCNDGSGRPTIREYRGNQSIPLSPFRPRKPRDFYVALADNANDLNPGSKEAPWKTLKRATSFLLPGDKLTVMPGIWRETLMLRCSGLPGKPITYTGIKGQTILRGDNELRTWERDPSDVRVWCRKYDISGVSEFPYGNPNADPKLLRYYNKRNPIDITVDGQPLFWCKTAKLDAGSYHVNRRKNIIYIRLSDDANPNQHKIEAISKFSGIDTPRNRDALWPGVSHYSISNFVVKRFSYGAFACGTNSVFSDNLIEWCSIEGFRGNKASNLTFKNNNIRWIGGLCSSFPGRSHIENNKILFGNKSLHCSGWHAAGMKSLGISSSHSVYKNNEFAYTSALGLWFDTWVSGCRVDGNLVHDNFHAGLEEEISLGNRWINNISYRNRFGISVHNGNNSVYENNILYDNYRAGIEWLFAHVGDRKGTPNYIPLEIKERSERSVLDTDPDYKRDCDMILKYYMPAKNRDNTFKRNLLINNGRIQLLNIENWRHQYTKKLVDPIPELTANNKFQENVFVASSPQQAVSGFNSMNAWEKQDPNATKNIFSNSIDGKDIPEWAKTRFAEAKQYLNYPRTLSSISKIRAELAVNHPYECFANGLTPSGLLAVSRICESELLEAKKFSDPMLKAYFIQYKGKRTLVLWRRQGRSSDIAPLLLKNLPENMKIETAWGEELEIPRKGSLASVMVGTWPIYLVDCPSDIVEQTPFEFNYSISEDTVSLSLKNGMGDGELIIDDKDNVCLQCPSSVKMINGKAEFKLLFKSKPDIAYINLRIAGYLDGLYGGGFFKVPLREDKGKKLSLEKMKMIPLKGNCDFNNILGDKIGSLEGMPGKIKLHNGNLEFGKTCFGFKTSRLKNGDKRPKSISLDLQNKKVKKIVLALVCAWAGKKTGAPLLAMNLFLDDNNVSSVNLRNNYEIRDWWNKPTENQQWLMESSGSFKIWEGDCGHGHEVTVYAYVWENPSPQFGIRSMELKTLAPNASIGLLGVGIE